MTPIQSRVIGLFTSLHDLDVNGDYLVTPTDALMVIAYLNTPGDRGAGEAEAKLAVTPPWYTLDEWWDETFCKRKRKQNDTQAHEEPNIR